MLERFYLGTHRPAWLGQLNIPLFVSDHTLSQVKSLPRALAPWALDSGGFTELDLHGKWTSTPAQFVERVRRYQREIGKLEFVPCQDWMCEAQILAKTGLTVQEHQARTVASYLELRSLAPEIPWIPVLQGWHVTDYWHHQDDYYRAGVELHKLPLVGVGSVCRRQGMWRATGLMQSLARPENGLRLHGFGYKTDGLKESWMDLVSADSLAWSKQARLRDPLPGHDKPGEGRRTGHKNCQNCKEFALLWLEHLHNTILENGGRSPIQLVH